MFEEMASAASQFVVLLFWIMIIFIFAWEILWFREIKKARPKD